MKEINVNYVMFLPISSDVEWFKYTPTTQMNIPHQSKNTRDVKTKYTDVHSNVENVIRFPNDIIIWLEKFSKHYIYFSYTIGDGWVEIFNGPTLNSVGLHHCRIK